MRGYLLDTNILSELRRPQGAEAVKRWLTSIASQDLFISVLTIGELQRGVELLRSRDPNQATALHLWLEGIRSQYHDKIIPIDEEVACRWGKLCLHQPLPVIDGLLAATALVHNLVLVTRNMDDFKRSGANVFNPFEFTG